MSVTSNFEHTSLSARRAWIEIIDNLTQGVFNLSLSARRAWIEIGMSVTSNFEHTVALRKESVDRNNSTLINCNSNFTVALRKESVDRNGGLMSVVRFATVALRKESVDRNAEDWLNAGSLSRSLSARRAWIEIGRHGHFEFFCASLSARRAWIEMTQCRL